MTLWMPSNARETMRRARKAADQAARITPANSPWLDFGVTTLAGVTDIVVPLPEGMTEHRLVLKGSVAAPAGTTAVLHQKGGGDIVTGYDRHTPISISGVGGNAPNADVNQASAAVIPSSSSRLARTIILITGASYVEETLLDIDFAGSQNPQTAAVRTLTTYWQRNTAVMDALHMSWAVPFTGRISVEGRQA